MSWSTVKYYATLYVANFFYLTGIALIIPLSILILFSAFLVSGSIVQLFVLSIVFTSIGAYIVYRVTKSKKKTMRALGSTTLIPAVISVLLVFVNERLVLGTILMYVENFDVVEPFIVRYLERTVPHSVFLTVGYIAFGGVLLYLSKR